MSTTHRGPAESNGAHSVDRAITVLEIIAGLGDASVSEVATSVGMHRSTISRLLAVLEKRGMVQVAGARGRYRLGPNILRLASAVSTPLDVSVQGADICEQLAMDLGETINIAITLGDSAVNVYQASGPGAITVNNWVGRPTPLHATSSGKVLLAWLDERALDAVLDRRLEPFTAQTITDANALRRQLAAARVDGYAVTVGELEDGLNAIAAPVRGPGGEVIAALSASAPSYRLPPELMPQNAAEVMRAADRIGRRMGYLV
ncbi:MAG TPA: IclR family transcriptional regulator [Microbacteriaceae bacterium]|jgi:DNA-binding IclR family transcriptional regulator|nr:IclR family transcriptional regulator [Microbacteriaceae bacterium]